MTLSCPRCQESQPEQNRICDHCGAALPLASDNDASYFRFAEPVMLAETRQSEGDHPGASQVLNEASSAAPLPNRNPQMLLERPAASSSDYSLPAMTPPTSESKAAWKAPVVLSTLVSLGILLCALAGAAGIVAHAKHAVSSVAVGPPDPQKPAEGLALSGLPMTVLLHSTADHSISVGTPVVITAITTLPEGKNAALALSCQPEQGPKTMFSFAEGRMCSANWIPTVPGRYKFTATVLDDQLRTAAARPLWISVNGSSPASPPPSVESQPIVAESIAPQPVVKVSRSLSEWRNPRTIHRVVRYHRQRRDYARLHAPILAPSPELYHVVAATFKFPGNAEILARALRDRGLPAVTGHQRTKHGKIAYQVEVGSYTLPDEAQQLSLNLQRSGYPAYIQRLK